MAGRLSVTYIDRRKGLLLAKGLLNRSVRTLRKADDHHHRGERQLGPASLPDLYEFCWGTRRRAALENAAMQHLR